MLNRAPGHAGPFAAKQDHGGSRCWEQAAAGAQRGHVMDRTGDAQQGTDGHGLAAGLCTGTPAVPGVMGNTGRICTQTPPLSCPSAFCCLPPGYFPDRRADSSQPSRCSALQRSRDGGGSAGAHTEPGMHGMCCNGGGVPGAHRFSCTMEAPFPDPHAALLNPPRVLPSSYPSWHPQIILGGRGSRAPAPTQWCPLCRRHWWGGSQLCQNTSKGGGTPSLSSVQPRRLLAIYCMGLP